MKSFFRSIKWNTTLSALLCICAGIALFIWPDVFTRIACRGIALLLFIIGIIHLISYFAEKQSAFRLQADLIIAILLLAVALWMYTSPDFFISLIPVVLGLVILIHGLQDIRYALQLKRITYDFWWTAAIFGILTTAFGLIVLFHPIESANTLTMLIGVALIYDGISDIWIVSRLSYSARRFHDKVGNHFSSFENRRDGVVYTVDPDDVTEEDD